MSIEIEALNFSYGAKNVLQEICLCIEPAQTLAILGPNGSGKTTLLNIVAGFLLPSSGRILYNGKTYKQFDLRQMAQLVGFVPQTIIAAFDYSVVDYVVTGCAPQIGTFEKPGPEHYEKAMQAIREMGIEHLAEKSYRQISGGERQQVSIARVLAQCPSYILMDEPTSNLDYGNQILVLKIIQRLAKNGLGVVFTTHNPDQTLLLGGKAAILDRNGKLNHGNSSELINGSQLSQLYGVQLCTDRFDEQGRKVCYAPDLNGGGQK